MPAHAGLPSKEPLKPLGLRVRSRYLFRSHFRTSLRWWLEARLRYNARGLRLFVNLILASLLVDIENVKALIDRLPHTSTGTPVLTGHFHSVTKLVPNSGEF